MLAKMCGSCRKPPGRGAATTSCRTTAYTLQRRLAGAVVLGIDSSRMMLVAMMAFVFMKRFRTVSTTKAETIPTTRKPQTKSWVRNTHRMHIDSVSNGHSVSQHMSHPALLRRLGMRQTGCRYGPNVDEPCLGV